MILRAIRHGLVDSTQARAWAAVEDGSARAGDVHVATAQEAGRGRRGTRWHSPSGPGLYLSAIVHLPGPAVAPGSWTAAGALALLDAIVPAGARSVRLKWPNDLVDGRGAKLAGVLAEARPSPPAGRPTSLRGGTTVVLGLGLNVGPMEFPPELEEERPVTDLVRLGCWPAGQQDGEALLAAVLASLALRLDQAETRSPSLSLDFLAALTLAGRRVRVETPQGVVHGLLLGLDLLGQLRLETGAGTLAFPVEHVGALRAPDH